MLASVFVLNRQQPAGARIQGRASTGSEKHDRDFGFRQRRGNADGSNTQILV
jgi:hypothetical protein